MCLATTGHYYKSNVFSYYWSILSLQSEKEQHVNTKQQLEKKLANEMNLTEEVRVYWSYSNISCINRWAH